MTTIISAQSTADSRRDSQIFCDTILRKYRVTNSLEVTCHFLLIPDRKVHLKVQQMNATKLSLTDRGVINGRSPSHLVCLSLTEGGGIHDRSPSEVILMPSILASPKRSLIRNATARSLNFCSSSLSSSNVRFKVYLTINRKKHQLEQFRSSSSSSNAR